MPFWFETFDHFSKYMIPGEGLSAINNLLCDSISYLGHLLEDAK